MIRKTLKYTLILFTLFMVSVLTVNAATKHQFSFQTYVCTDWSDSLLDCNVDYTQVANGGSVNPGDVVRLDLMYVPGDNPDISFQLGFTFNNTVLSPIYDGDELLYVAPQPPYYDGIYPAAGTSSNNMKRTNWVISTNQYQNGIYSLYEDTTQNTTLNTAGLLTSYYFKVVSGATPGTEMNFNYDATYTMFNNDSEFTVSNTTLEVFKVKDTDPSLKGIIVKHSGTNYLTNFNSTTKTYNVYVPNSVSNVEIMGDPTKSTTVLTYSPTASGNVYGPLTVSSWKTVTISTVAEDGQHTDQYTVKVYRLSNANTLNSLSLSGISIGNFSSGTTTYTVTNPVPYATSSTTITASPASNKATVSPASGTSVGLNVGSNQVQVVVTPECAKSAYSSVPNNGSSVCQSKTYTVNVTRTAASTNNYLSGLTVNGTSVPNFQKTNEGPYNVTVGYDTSTVNVVATPEDTEFAVVSGQTGNQSVNVGDTTLTVTVTPQDPNADSRNYTIKVHRKSNNANLGSLTVTSSPQGTLSPSTFSAGTTSYTYTVGPDVTEVSIAATKANSNQTSITGTGTYNPQTQTKAEIVVAAEDSTKTKTYTVNLVRNKSTDVTLDELSVAGYNLSPSYGDSTNSYTVTVPSNVNSVNVTATPHDSRTTATVSGKTTGLSTGDNTVTVTVTPEAGETAKRTITITVKKLAGNANLSSLSLTNVSYTPSFDAGEISYSATVPYTTSQTKITAGLADSKASKTIKLNGTTISENTNVNLNVGTNTFTVLVKAEDTNVTKTYTVTVTRTAPSTNNYLSSLTVNSSSVPSFNKINNGPYNVTVGYDTTKVTIAATAEDTEFATVTGDTGQKNVSVGDNTFEVTVTPQDPDTDARTYTIKVHRKSNYADLGSLTVSSNPQGTLSPSTFSANTTSYTYTVGPDVTEVSIAATKGNSNQTSITGTGIYNPQTQTKAEIVVAAEDSSKTKTYTVNLVRNKSTDVRLSELSVAGYTISPDYSDSINNYSVIVPSNVSSIDVTATPIDSRTTASVSGNTNLQTGNNTVTVTVTPEAGETAKRTITINVKKLENNANLSGLNLTNVTYTPPFSAGTTSYTANVAYTTDKTKITASLASNKATKVVTLDDVTKEENKDITLAVGANTFKVVVTPECANSTYSTVPGNSGNACQTKTYTVVVNRAEPSGDAYLTNLTIDGTTVEGFDSSIPTYNVIVAPNVESITIGATANELSVVAPTSDIGLKTLDVGMNNFVITATAQDQETHTIYYLNVKKLDNSNKLTGLTVSSSDGSLDPTSFNENTTSYTYTAGPNVTEVTVNATAPSSASIAYSPSTTNNKYDPHTINKVDITVTPECANSTYSSVPGNSGNACQTKTYTVNLARTESSINTLNGITVNGVPVPGFDPATTEYTVNVPYNTPTMTVAATPADGDRETVNVISPTTYGVGDNTYTIAVEAEDGTPNTYTVVVHRKNNDATLSSLSLDNVTLNEDFDPDIIEYTATVPYTTTTTALHYTTTDTSLPSSNVSTTGGTTLNVGENNFTVTVTPEDADEAPKTYRVKVTRTAASDLAYLTDLSIDGTTVNGFDKDTTTYTVNVPSTTDEVTIGATGVEFSKVTGDTGTKALSTGNNEYTITVTSQSENESIDYNLIIRRLSADNKLTNLTITSSEGSMEPSTFNPNTPSYTYTAGPDVTEVTISATGPSGSTVTYSPQATDNKYDPNSVSSVTITVTPEDTDAEKGIYTITLDRTASSINTLSGISIDNVPIEGFDPNNDAYTVDVDSETNAVSIVATPTDVGRANVSIDGPDTLSDGDNEYTITVTAEDNTPKEYTVTVHKKSSDNTLSSLSLENVDFSFDSGTRTYTITVPYTTEETSVTATPNHPSATKVIKKGDDVITSSATLDVGENVFTVTVTPEDTEAEKGVYTVTVTRENVSTTAYLTSLTVDGESVPEFSKDTKEYTIDVSNATAEVVIAATANQYSTVAGDVGTKSLTVGDNEFEVVAVSQDGNERIPYKVTIHRKDNNNKLSDLVITADPAGSLTPSTGFDPDVTEYTYTVGPDTPAITVTGTPAGGATVTGDGTFDPTTTDKIEVVVTPEDGTPQTYTINVVRNKSTNVDLLSLGIDGYTISPSFEADKILYTLTVPNNVTEVTVVAEKGDSRQTIDGLGTKGVNVGDNPLQVVVTPEDPNTEPKTYTIVVTREANDNNYLSGLSVTGFNLKEGFNKELQSYTLEVPTDTNSITVNATPEVNTSNVTITGADSLANDTNTVTITVVSQKGTPRDYTITVTKTDDAEFITSVAYGHIIEDGMIKTVIYKSKPNELKDQLDNENEKLHVYATNDSTEEISDTSVLATGYIIKLIKNGNVKDSKSLVIKGDVDGNGKVTLFDAVKVLNHYLEKETLTGAYFEAADTNSSGDITLFDAVGVLRIYLADTD